MPSLYYILKRSGEIAVTSLITLLVVMILVDIIANVKGGAAAQAQGSYSATAVLLVKAILGITLASATVVTFLYVLLHEMKRRR